jgi:glycerate 2-kinase
VKRAPAQAAGRWDSRRLRKAAATILHAALDVAEPGRLVERNLRHLGTSVDLAGRRFRMGPGRLFLVAAGKAALRMADAAERQLGDAISAGIVVAPAEQPRAGRRRRAGRRLRSRVLEASHPVPDGRGERAAYAIETLAASLNQDDCLLLLLSGGASALLPAPAAGILLRDKMQMTSLLLGAGATIHEVNTVRKHLSRLKGGGLARVATPARIVCLALSDVVGDDPATIASGPTVGDPTTFGDALAVLDRYGLARQAPPAARRRLESGALGRLAETAKPGDPLFRRVRTTVIGSNRLSLEAAAKSARLLGLKTIILTTTLAGEAREAARCLTAILRECAEHGRPGRPPVCLLAGGETTVTVRGKGRGGRNQELALSAVEPLASLGRHALVASFGTDGIDGASDAAGAVADETSLERAARLRLAPVATFLNRNDSYSFFASLGDLILTGPTGTNVADLVVLLAGDRSI